MSRFGRSIAEVTTKRQNIEFLLGWFNALRAKDLPMLAGGLAADVVWQGLRPEITCRGRRDVVQMFLDRRAEGFEIDAIEVIGAETGAIFCASIPGGYEFEGERIGPVYNFFRIEDGRITRIEDYRERSAALKAANQESR